MPMFHPALSLFGLVPMRMLSLCLLVTVPVFAQVPVSIEESRVREIIEFLASDELAGRDTPSEGLDKAAEFIAAGFKTAGLKPVGGTYFHVYEQAGQRHDSAAVKVTLFVKGQENPVELRPNVDVRIYRSGSEGFSRERSDIKIMTEAEMAGARRRRQANRDPILIIVDEGNVLWATLAGKREVFARGRGRGRGLSRAPMLLVRRAALPEGEIESASVTVPAPEQIVLKLRNVMAMLPGGKHADEFVAFTSHYDHIGIGLAKDGDAIFNGADDDATGTTAVLALAEAYAKAGEELDRTLLFVCFSAEEKGLVGSRAFVADPPVPLADIAVNLNLEMLGRPPTDGRMKAWVTGREYSDFEAIARPAMSAAGIELIEFAMATRLFGSSDNASFANAGIVAHSISGGELHSDYHQVGDEVDRIDIEHMTAVIRGIYAVGLEFANRAERPKYNSDGLKALNSRRR